MYVPDQFAEPRVAELERLIRAHPFAALVTLGPDGLDANHLPFELDGTAGPGGRLLAHVARANPVWRQVRDDERVLVIFRAADAYISPNWYPSKHATHRQVPTWNYQVTHVHGRIHVRDDERFVRGVVARLTREHEARAAEPRPWKMGDSERSYIDGMLAAVVGLEIAIDRVEGKSKLSQNKAEPDRIGASDALSRRGQTALADAMLSAVSTQQTGENAGSASAGRPEPIGS